ncbi:MAG: hypothetical protein Q8L14_12490 [Myxococcales bacterium]|nr:hypothetical protein [Myxococcales bacterium]
MLSAKDLDRKKPAAQRTTVEQWVAWRRAGDPRAAGFWTAASAVLSLEVKTGADVQALFLDELVASARFLGSDARPLARALGVIVRRGSLQHLGVTLKVVEALFGTSARVASVGLLRAVAARRDLGASEHAALIDTVAAILGPPRVSSPQSQSINLSVLPKPRFTRSGKLHPDDYARLSRELARVLGPPARKGAHDKDILELAHVLVEERGHASAQDAVEPEVEEPLFENPLGHDLTESGSARLERLEDRPVLGLMKVVETLRRKRVDVSSLDARLPPYVAPPAPESLAALAKKVASKGDAFQLDLPSGRLSMHTSVDPDIVTERRFAQPGRLVGHRLDDVVLLSQKRAVRWSTPQSDIATALYAGDAEWLLSVYADFGSDVAQALVGDVFSDGALISSERLGSATPGPDVLVVTSSQEYAAWSYGTDARGRVVAVLIHARGLFTGWKHRPARRKVYPARRRVRG